MSSFPIQDNGGEQIQYTYSSYEAYIGHGYMSSCPDFRFPSHWHEDIEMSVVLNGEMTYNVNGHLVPVHKGDAFFINSRQLHGHYAEPRTDCEYICVLLHPMLLRLNPAFEEEFVLPILKNEGLSYMKFTEDVPWQRDIRDELLQLYAEQERPEAPLLLQAHFCKIWALLFTHIDTAKNQGGSSENLQIIKKMLRFIQENYRDALTLSDIAFSGAVGQSKCCKLFKEYISTTPMMYVNHFRLNKSRTLLENTDRSITDIAAAVGFSGASYFTECFRACYHQSPTEYRRVLKQAAPHK